MGVTCLNMIDLRPILDDFGPALLLGRSWRLQGCELPQGAQFAHAAAISTSCRTEGRPKAKVGAVYYQCFFQKLLAGCARSPTPSRKHYNAKSGFRRHESGIGVKPKIIPRVLTGWILRRLQFAAVRPAYTQVKRCAHLAEVMTHDQHFSVLFPIGAGEPAQHLGSRRAVCIAIFG